jgi:hypothetical protein
MSRSKSNSSVITTPCSAKRGIGSDLRRPKSFESDFARLAIFLQTSWGDGSAGWDVAESTGSFESGTSCLEFLRLTFQLHSELNRAGFPAISTQTLLSE